MNAISPMSLATSPVNSLLPMLSSQAPTPPTQDGFDGSNELEEEEESELSALIQMLEEMEQMSEGGQPETGSGTPGGPVQPPPNLTAPGGGPWSGSYPATQPESGGSGSSGGSGTSGNGSPGNAGGGTPGGAKSLPGAQIFNNLQDSSKWHYNTDAAEIGGSGKNLSMKITPGQQSMNYDSDMGSYGDTLGSLGTKYNPDDTKFQTNYTLDPSAKTFKNTQAIEDDLVTTNSKGQQAMFATQFNLKEKAPAGMCWFQTNNYQTGKWENAALVPIPKAGQNNNVSLTDTMNPNGTFTYGPLTYDGKTYNLANNTFDDKVTNWTRNQAVWQVQEDATSNGGPIDETYSNMQLQAS